MVISKSLRHYVVLTTICLGIALQALPSAAESRGELIDIVLGKTISQLNYHALIIGINGYNPDSGWMSLAYPESDTNRLEKVLRTGYEFESITYLKGGKATKSAIRATLDKYKTTLGKDDAIFIFYAGHGHTITEGDKRGGYWIPVDASKSIDSWLSIDELHEFMNQTDARHVLLVSDSCYAGAFFTRGKLATDSIESASLYARQIVKPSRYIITSGDMEEVPDKSAFAQHFLNFLEDIDRPYIASAENIYYQIKRPVYVDTGTHVIAKEMMRGEAGGSFIFAQKQAVNKEGTLIVEVSPPGAKVVAGINNDYVSAIVLNENEERVKEHRFRIDEKQEFSLEISLPGYHPRTFSWQAKSLQRKRRQIRLKEWLPVGFNFLQQESNEKYQPMEVINEIIERVNIDQQTWNRKQVTTTSESISGDYAAISTYGKERFLNERVRHANVYYSDVIVIDKNGKTTKLRCYRPEPKGKDEKSSRKIRDVVFLPQNEKYLIALSGDHLFLWNHIESRLITKTALPRPLKYSEKAQVVLSTSDQKPVLTIRAERTPINKIEVTTL